MVRGQTTKVFGYLKPFEQLTLLTQTLANQNVRAVIYAPEVREETRANLSGNKIRFIDQPAKLPESIRNCRFIINNGNLATVCSALLAGIPLLLIPRTLEEFFTARAVEHLQAGVSFVANKHANPQERIQLLLNDDVYMHKAKAFARKYRDTTGDQASHAITEIVKAML